VEMPINPTALLGCGEENGGCPAGIVRETSPVFVASRAFGLARRRPVRRRFLPVVACRDFTEFPVLRTLIA
jgi:hypothetical protein